MVDSNVAKSDLPHQMGHLIRRAARILQNSVDFAQPLPASGQKYAVDGENTIEAGIGK